jgi:hypothetical protein
MFITGFECVNILISDSVCDAMNNIPSCDFDGGDCRESTNNEGNRKPMSYPTSKPVLAKQRFIFRFCASSWTGTD